MLPGPIVLIDDDTDDVSFLKSALEDLHVKNEVITFSNARDALQYFETTTQRPFVVLCDINMPEINGFELREKIHNSPQLCIGSFPFLFLSTAGGNPIVNNAYNLNVQGYFIKPSRVEEIETMMQSIISYWSICQHPTHASY